ncbi:MAG TPA: nucleotide excision repair endonuclease, partial [Thermodesulfobacteriota bacterium]|nr:nucleotide excision repair endonuclease [Thermodesulfobacteriota bacterium]
MNTLDQKIDHLPAAPGVYLFKDKKGAILYVGKAGNIRHRVNSYFQNPAGKDL